MPGRIVPLLLFVASLSACSTQGFRDPRAVVSDVDPETGALREQHALQLSSSQEVSAESGLGAGTLWLLGPPTRAVGLSGKVFSNAQSAVLYLIYDPLAPNWTIQERKLNEETYNLSLKAKSYRVGGDGEAMRIIKRRAFFLQQEKGYSSYRILDYSEGVESSTPWTHRVSEDTIQLVRAAGETKP